MIQPLHREILHKLAEICDLSPDVRFGQMVDFMGFLGQDTVDQPLVQIEDEDFLKVLERHLADLRNRDVSVEPRA
jgi:hypothetical protein